MIRRTKSFANLPCLGVGFFAQQATEKWLQYVSYVIHVMVVILVLRPCTRPTLMHKSIHPPPPLSIPVPLDALTPPLNVTRTKQPLPPKALFLLRAIWKSGLVCGGGAVGPLFLYRSFYLLYTVLCVLVTRRSCFLSGDRCPLGSSLSSLGLHLLPVTGRVYRACTDRNYHFLLSLPPSELLAEHREPHGGDPDGRLPRPLQRRPERERQVLPVQEHRRSLLLLLLCLLCILRAPPPRPRRQPRPGQGGAARGQAGGGGRVPQGHGQAAPPAGGARE